MTCPECGFHGLELREGEFRFRWEFGEIPLPGAFWEECPECGLAVIGAELSSRIAREISYRRFAHAGLSWE